MCTYRHMNTSQMNPKLRVFSVNQNTSFTCKENSEPSAAVSWRWFWWYQQTAWLNDELL